MGKILIPIDFTEVSDNAFQYAYDMTGEKDQLCVVHVISGLVDVNVAETIALGESREKGIYAAIKQRILSKMSWKVIPNRIEIKLLEGDVIGSLRKHITGEMYDAVVMGTRDNYDIIDRWFGTISLGVVKTLRIPVYLIPRHSRYKDFKKVMVASDYHLLNKELISRIIDWNKNIAAFIEFLHIRTSENDEYEFDKEKVLNALIERESLNFAFQMKTIVGKDIADSILSSAYNEKSDLLILIAENRSYINTMLFKSLSRDMILKSNIPVLFMH